MTADAAAAFNPAGATVTSKNPLATRTIGPSEGSGRAHALDLTVVIPAFNERAGVGSTVDRVRRAFSTIPCSFEIVVVDDGSNDGTGELARAAGARVVTLPRNCGYGAAIKAGVAESASELVAIIDADGTYPPEALPGLVALARDADMVVGARAGRDVSIPWVRRPARWVLARLAGYLAERHIPDVNSGLRVMRRSALMRFLHLAPSGFSLTTTLTLALLCCGHRVVYEPIACAPRVGSSKLRAVDFTNFVILVLRTVVLFNPLKIFLPLGTGIFLLGLAKLVYDVAVWNLSETAVMCLLAAIVVWSVGLLADMIARLQLRPPGAG